MNWEAAGAIGDDYWRAVSVSDTGVSRSAGLSVVNFELRL